jgi:hypothetical protein
MRSAKSLDVINKVLKQKEHLVLLERNNISNVVKKLEEISSNFEDNYKESFYLWEDWPDKEDLHSSVISDIDRVEALFYRALEKLQESYSCMELLERSWNETINPTK